MRKSLILLLLALTLTLQQAQAQSRDKVLTITVTTDTGDDLSGQVVTLVQTDYTLSYGTLKLDAEGTCTVKVYGGNHELSVDRPGYEPASTTFTIAADATTATASLHLTEKVRTPFALIAQARHDAYTGDNSVEMAWNTEAPAFFDDFESYPAFAVQFGDWTGIDADLEAAAPIIGDYPNRGVMQYAQIINPLEVTPTWWYDYPILRPYSGKQYVGFTRTSSGNANDDWLISPVVTVGNEHALMFMGKAADRFDERFMVYVTTKTDAPTQGDFTRLDQGNFETADYKGWHQYEYALDAYAGQQVRFAIRYISHYNVYGSFMLMLDDVYVGQPKDYDNAAAKAKAKARRTLGGHRIPASPSQATGARRSEANPNEVFHIYMDGTEVGVTESYDYTVGNVPPGRHVMGVKATYRAAESEMVTTPVEIGSEWAGVTFLVTAESILTPDGQVIRLVNTSTSESYEVTVAEGKAAIPSLPLGDYVVNVEEGAFNAYQQTITVTGDTELSITLTDRVITPYNITSEHTDDGDVILRWNQELVFTDSFEDYADFSTGTFGEWKSIDRDQTPVYPIALGDISNVVTFPGSGTAANPQPLAPIVFNPWNTTPPMLPTDPAVEAPTGDKTIAFFSPQRGKADKWLISPPIDIREGYALTTTLKSYDAMYAESAEFCVSEGGDNPSDFTSISSALDIPSTVWTQYQTSLADYAGKKVRLAVHYISYDTFFLQLDDFTVGPEDGEAPFVDYGNVLRYDIYVDGTKVGESQTPTYTLSGLTEGTHIIGIVAVYPNGDSPMGTITITVTAIARVTLDNGNAATLHTITGQKVGGDLSRQQRGIYIIQQGNQYKKTIKR
ncbi:MAG: choice-of-anchor J domain-containing protein [Prevotella sp.]|nr:choice-of-anchor J domain-containing protein [Prevotella sp.]